MIRSLTILLLVLLPQGSSNLERDRHVAYFESLVYPSFARFARVTGIVEIEALVDPDGIVRELKLVGSADEILAREALENVRRWRFERSQGSTRHRIRFEFKFDGEPSHQSFTRLRVHLPSRVEVVTQPPI